MNQQEQKALLLDPANNGTAEQIILMLAIFHFFSEFWLLSTINGLIVRKAWRETVCAVKYQDKLIFLFPCCAISSKDLWDQSLKVHLWKGLTGIQIKCLSGTMTLQQASLISSPIGADLQLTDLSAGSHLPAKRTNFAWSTCANISSGNLNAYSRLLHALLDHQEGDPGWSSQALFDMLGLGNDWVHLRHGKKTLSCCCTSSVNAHWTETCSILIDRKPAKGDSRQDIPGSGGMMARGQKDR